MTQPASEAAFSTLGFRPSWMEVKKTYDKKFLMSLQFVAASLKKPNGLPPIKDVVFDKPHLPDSRDPALSTGNQLRPVEGSQRPAEKAPDVQPNLAEETWKMSLKKPTWHQLAKESEEGDIETKILLKQFRGILNKMMPEKLDRLMRQVAGLKINTEDKLKGVVELIFEKAIAEPTYSEEYAKMSRMLSGLKVRTQNNPGEYLNFRKLLMKESLREFQSDKTSKWIFEKKMEELKDSQEEEKQRVAEELQESRDRARWRSLGHTVFMGELFKLKMITGNIMHDYIVKLFKNHDEESLECLCKVFLTVGKNLDVTKSKTRIDQYCNQMKKIIKNRKTSFRIRFKLQDVLDLRQNNWEPRKADQYPKTLEQNQTDPELQMDVLPTLKVKDEGTEELERPAVDGEPNGAAGSLSPSADASEMFDVQLLPPAVDEDTKKTCCETPRLDSGSEPNDCSSITTPVSSNRSSLDPERHTDTMVTVNEVVESTEAVCRGVEKQEDCEELKTDIPPADNDPKVQTTQHNLESTHEEPQENSLSAAELAETLDALLREESDNQRILDWSKELQCSNMFLRVLITSVCKSAIICDKVFTVNVLQIYQRAELLQSYLRDEQKQLQALHALQALMVQMDHPPYLLRMFFVALHDQDVISDKAFFMWESSTDPEEQEGRGQALKTVEGFLVGLIEAAKAETEYSEPDSLEQIVNEMRTHGDS